MNNPKQLFAAIAIALACGACSKSALDHEKAGDQLAAAGKLAEAAIEYRSALTISSDRSDIRLKLADVFMAQGDTRSAFPQYIRAADQRPDDLPVQVKAGYLLLKGGLFKEARERARVVLQRDPKDLSALLLLGNALAGLKSLDEASAVFERAIAVDPDMIGVYTSLGVMQLARDQYAEAEATFQRAIAANPESAEAHLNLGNFYRAVGKPADAEAALKTALRLDPTSIRTNQALASVYIETKRVAEAEPFLKSIIATSKDPGASYTLADYYLAYERPQDGLAVLEQLAASPAEFARAKIRMAQWHFQRRERSEAQRIVESVLAKFPRNAPALTLKARLLLADGKASEALDTTKLALSADPGSADTHLAIARILTALNRIDDAAKEYQQVLAVDSTSLPAHLELAEFHRKRGEFDTAISHADKAIEASPSTFEARVARFRILLAREDTWPRAAEDVRILSERFPNSTIVQSLAGEYQLTVGNKTAAGQSFTSALQLGASAEALTGLVALDLTAGNTATAVARIEAVLAKEPNAPGPLLLAAKVYGLQGETKKAEDTLLRVITLTPDNPAPYAILAQLYYAQGRTDDAARHLKELARAEPNSVGAPTMLGVLAYAKGDLQGAQMWWQRALEINPNAAAPANNLAWVYADTESDLDKALQLAQTARTALPEQPEINDTLGWVYYKKKFSDRAIDYFRRAVERDTQNPVYQFHLGLAYAQTGEDSKARSALLAALKLDPKFPDADKAQKALSQLVF